MTITTQDLKIHWTERLNLACRRLWQTNEQMAEYLGVSRSMVYRWRTGKAVPKRVYYEFIAARAELPVEWLMPNKDELEQSQPFLAIGDRPAASAAEPTKYTPRDLNPEPTDWVLWLVDDVIAEAEALLQAAAL